MALGVHAHHCLHVPQTVVREIRNLTSEDGKSVTYNGAKGISFYKEADGTRTLYICNTDADGIESKNGEKVGNIYQISLEEGKVGQIIKTITLPDSPLIPDLLKQTFSPIRITRDQDGYIYVLSHGCFYGALLYHPSGEFLGFYGANTVKTTLNFPYDSEVIDENSALIKNRD